MAVFSSLLTEVWAPQQGTCCEESVQHGSRCASRMLGVFDRTRIRLLRFEFYQQRLHSKDAASLPWHRKGNKISASRFPQKCIDLWMSRRMRLQLLRDGADRSVTVDKSLGPPWRRA